jgi:hypothetical protein
VIQRRNYRIVGVVIDDLESPLHQPLAVRAWCAPCLFTALAMLLMIPLSLDEIVAMVQFVAKQKREGHSAWRVFWLGGDQADDRGERTDARADTWQPRGMLWGCTSTWTLWPVAAIGVWLMAAPAVFGVAIDRPAADSDHLVGALLVVISIICLAEVARPARFLVIPLGGWLLIASWFLTGGTAASRADSAALGLAVILLGVPLGRVRDHYGTFDRIVRWPRGRTRPLHAR